MHGRTASFPDYSFYATDQLVAAYAAGHTRYQFAIAGLSEEQFRARPRGATRWSIHEIIMHTADSELQGSFRVRKTFAEPPAIWPVHDQDLWSKALDYQGQDREARERSLALIDLVRRQALAVFERARGDDWLRSGTHPEFGTLTLRNLLELYADHIERHLEQIVESRSRMGDPVALEPLLPRRLY